MQGYRVKSASAARSRLSIDTQILQDTVIQLQQQLLGAKREHQKSKDQLNCLISLVKRAWSGDKSAVLHVANIVGVAPPDVKTDAQDENHTVVTAQTKSPAVNNWARLTIGLINRQYCHLEREVEELQRVHLMDRTDFLSQQVEKGYSKPQETERWDVSGLIQPPSTPPQPTPTPQTLVYHRAGSAPVNRKPVIKHLYRPANQRHSANQTNGNEVPNVTVGDMVSDDKSPYNGPEECLLDKLAHTYSNGLSNGASPSRLGSYNYSTVHRGRYTDDPYGMINYADPRKYSVHGLFDEENALGPDGVSKPRRPSSGKDLKQSDSLRARPKSAVLPKGERPLKYETTRPISAKHAKSDTANRHGILRRPRAASAGDIRNTRPVSGKRPTKQRTFLTRDTENDGPVHDLHLNLDFEDQPSNGNHGDVINNNGNHDDDDSDADSWDSQAEAREQRNRAVQEILVKIKCPESVKQYEQELLSIGKMEKDFRERTIDLQKKLGIDPGGMVL